MKTNHIYRLIIAALTSLVLGFSSLAVHADLKTNVINTFESAGSYGGGIGREWGPSSAAWDGNQGLPSGAEQIATVWDPTSDTPLTAYACKGDGANPWYTPNPINFSEYKTLEFDVLYDNTSDITIDEFNDVSSWPLTLTNSVSGGQSVFQSWASQGQLAAGGSVGGLEIDLCGGPGGQMAPFIINTNMPYAASNGWTHVVIPINQAESQIDGVSGIVFHKWCANTWVLQYPVTARFWIDNVMLIGTNAPPPPPTVSVPTFKATPGLNVFASTEGNSFYDRQEVELRQSTGLSWVGYATSANPVTYSFAIAGYPNSVNCEAYLFLVPNPAYVDSAPDWNETNCAIFYIQGDRANATARFRYKVNEPSQQAMYGGGNEGGKYYTNAPGSWDGATTPWYESGDLGSVTNNTVLGTWTVKFTSDTNVTLIAPNGNTSSFIFPSYNAGYFAESTGFNVYLGMQANQADAMNQAVVYSDFAVSNTASPFSENFLTDSVLDTVNIWATSMSGGPQGVLLVTNGASQWMTWTLPDSGFGLQASSSLSDPLLWNDLTAGPVVPLYGYKAQLVSSNEIPAGDTAFFRLIKREFTQLQVLLPGETNAPNTVSGKVGTPDPEYNGGLTTVTVSAVDSTFHIVSVSGDTISLTSSDPNFVPSSTGTLAGGTVQITGVFGSSSPPDYTITATDSTNTNIPPATSSAVTVQ